MRLRITAVLIGMALGAAAPAAHAQLTVANNCTTPTTGTNTAPNRPCWIGGIYNDAYTGPNDVDYIGPPAQVVGGHPFTGVTEFIVGNTAGMPDGTVKDVRVVIPPGLVSDPLATPTCSDAQLTAGTCPANTQLGIVKLEAFLGVDLYVGASVYNMPVESQCSGYVSDYAFYVAFTKERIDICGSVTKQPPYNLYFTIAVPQTSPSAATVASTLIFWGVPGDSGHNPDRGWSCGPGVTPCTPPATAPGTPSGTPFLTNPTACLPAGQETYLTLTSTTGQIVQAPPSTTPVGAIDCSSLAFSPQLSLQLKGANQVKVGKHPTVVANLTMAPGQANIATSQVTLPLSLALDPTNSQQVCADAAAYVDNCPSNTLVGSAVATTPILGVPLSGPAYLVQGVRCASGQPTLQGTCPSGIPLKTEPWLLVELRGGGAAIDLHAVTSVVHNKLVTTFFNLPDLPESTFQLTINGGKRGILVVTGNKSLCSYKKQIAPTLFTAQNGATERANLKITTPCKAPKKHKH
jgi:hypothetical protein